jgi:NAD(P)-dependent dehydrogenase (short-subunit alcohol dehydrogenase family)
MKIAITGHTAGIGRAFTKLLESRGHGIVGISRRLGENIRRIEHTANLIEPCDMFINNAQTSYAQTELLYAVWSRWQGIEGKYIWNISTQMIEHPINDRPDGQDDLIMSQYRNQKIALEEASRQLKFKNQWPQISIIRPGGVATQEKFDNTHKADVDLWVKSVVDTFSHYESIIISEISVGYTKRRIPI